MSRLWLCGEWSAGRERYSSLRGPLDQGSRKRGTHEIREFCAIDRGRPLRFGGAARRGVRAGVGQRSPAGRGGGRLGGVHRGGATGFHKLVLDPGQCLRLELESLLFFLLPPLDLELLL